MDILYSSSDSYAFLTGISLLSLLENNRSCAEIRIWIMDNRISEENRNKIAQVAARYQRELTFVPMPDMKALTGKVLDTRRWNISTFGRLFIASTLPASVHTVLDIDCDTIIEDTLEPLWDMDMTGKVCAGVLECWPAYAKENVGQSAEGKYLNAGIVYFNLDEVRQGGYEKRFIDYIARYGDSLAYLDQEVLNGVVPQEKIEILPLRYNTAALYFYTTWTEAKKIRQAETFYSPEEYEQAKQDPAIVHFTTCFLDGLRPWIEGNRHPYLQEFLRYKSMSPWKDRPLDRDPRGALGHMKAAVLKTMPRFMVCDAAALMRGIVQPRISRIKMRRAEKGYLRNAAPAGTA